MSDDELQDLALAAYLSNIGVIGINTELLVKEGKYTDFEYDAMTRHCEIGASMIEVTTGNRRAASYVLYHHERIDGNGYPSGLKMHGILLNHIGQLLITQGYDGIFLDTIGDVEMPNLVNPTVQIDGAVRLVQNLRKWFPNAVLVQNNGLELLCMQTAPDLDGIAWENPPLQVQGSQGWVNAIAKRLSMLQQKYGIVPMVLFEDRNQMSRQDWLVRRDFSDQHGFCSYYAPKHYMSLRTIQE